MLGRGKSKPRERPESFEFTEPHKPFGIDYPKAEEDSCACPARSPYLAMERREKGSLVETQWWCANCGGVVGVRQHKPLFPPDDTPNGLLSL